MAYAVSCLGQQDIVIMEKQSEAIKSIYEGKDVFAWLPTGYRKSLRYQLLLFHFDFQLGRTRAIATERSVALVISPLVSLMMDHVCSLQAHGVCAAIRNSGNTWVSKALLATERDIAQGKLRFLFTALGAIVGYSRRKQMLLELSDSGMAVTVLYCVYKLMCPHTLSVRQRGKGRLLTLTLLYRLRPGSQCSHRVTEVFEGRFGSRVTAFSALG